MGIAGFGMRLASEVVIRRQGLSDAGVRASEYSGLEVRVMANGPQELLRLESRG